ncbi:MAG TPA: Eco57I restriction-modification methylase domain-containing protein [Trueperaceae bacterium]
MSLSKYRPSRLLGELPLPTAALTIEQVRGLIFDLVRTYWLEQGGDLPLRELADFGAEVQIDPRLSGALEPFGKSLAQMSPLDASFVVGRLYTALLPREYRSRHGIYFTPPPLARRLLELTRKCGVDLGTAAVLDPACGGGAFLAPVATAKLAQYRALEPSRKLELLSRTISGYEIDRFSAWLSQVFLDTVFRPVAEAAGEVLPVLISVRDALEEIATERYDLVIGNPPYGRVKLDKDRRQLFQRGLYGHANNYGLFTDLALRLTRQGGVVAFVTPTSFLSGQYFKNLRRLLVAEASPVHLEFISDREGVFDDVLQETMLATFRREASSPGARVRRLNVQPEGDILVEDVGALRLPGNPELPWLLPREPGHSRHVDAARRFPNRLRDFGYRVSTGPLVWNRHKNQLRSSTGPNRYPLVWAEAVKTDGTFTFSARRRNHLPYFEVRPVKDDWLLVRSPCILLQRTTAKEQRRRLIAAELPQQFLDQHGAAVVENHLNMIWSNGAPTVPPRIIASLLNSQLLDELFRCLSGSVAVSAFELEELPLPPRPVLERYLEYLDSGAPVDVLDEVLESAYRDGFAPTPAPG